jgi:hypothetical protein
MIPTRKFYQMGVQCPIRYWYARLLDIVQYAVRYFEYALIDDVLIRPVRK